MNFWLHGFNEKHRTFDLQGPKPGSRPRVVAAGLCSEETGTRDGGTRDGHSAGRAEGVNDEVEAERVRECGQSGDQSVIVAEPPRKYDNCNIGIYNRKS